MVPIFKGKGDAMSWGGYRGVKMPGHVMKIVEKVLEKRLQVPCIYNIIIQPEMRHLAQ